MSPSHPSVGGPSSVPGVRPAFTHGVPNSHLSIGQAESDCEGRPVSKQQSHPPGAGTPARHGETRPQGEEDVGEAQGERARAGGLESES